MYAPIPDGQVKILKGVPLDASYNHTIYFASAAAQTSYFSGKAKYSYTQLMYVRETRRVRVLIAADSIMDCNYLMYTNTQYLDKWFYAFINQVYYVNDNCTEIEFEIDVMQTWALDYEIKPSFIERNHTVTDAIGDNDVTESLDIGTYIAYGTERYSNVGSDWSVVMFSTFNLTTLQSAGGSLIGGSYSALERTVIGRFTVSNGTGTWVNDARTIIADLINNHADLVDGVVAIVITPTNFENFTALADVWNFSKLTALPAAAGNYTIRNKKLFTAPFYVAYVSDGSGSGKMYMPDKFDNATQMKFDIISDNAPAQTLIATPVGYKQKFANSNNLQNDSEALFMTGFAQCAWISDSFKQYLAQNQSNIGLSAALGFGQYLLGAGMIAFSGGAAAGLGLGMAAGGLSQVVNTIADLSDKSKRAPESHGNVTGTAFMKSGNKTFICYHLMPDLEHIRIIDDFFDQFGYAIHEVGVPNISSRPHWNYVKLQNAVILPASGKGLPASDLKKICQIFERGVTFWKSGSEVGNYNLDNRPV